VCVKEQPKNVETSLSYCNSDANRRYGNYAQYRSYAPERPVKNVTLRNGLLMCVIVFRHCPIGNGTFRYLMLAG
jgi:hypothetical protein